MTVAPTKAGAVVDEKKSDTPREASLPPVPEAHNWEKFRRDAHAAIDWIVDYQRDLQAGTIPVNYSVQPGFLREALPQVAPEQPEEWGRVMSDFQQHIVPGMTHWQHPNFYAYFPSLVSPPALLGDLLMNAMNQPGFTWACSPSATELELVVMDWLRKAFQLPESMSWGGSGGGVMQTSATEGMMVSMIGARSRALAGAKTPGEVTALTQRLTAYYSDQSHFCVEKAARALGIAHSRKIRSVFDATTGNYPIDLDALKAQLEVDVAAGLRPFFVSVSFGATGVCAVDPLSAVGDIAKQYDMWFNVDAAYAGAVGLCPELRPLMDGVEKCDVLLINGSKWLGFLFNAAFMFFTDKRSIVTALSQTAAYVENEHTAAGRVADLKDYQLGLGRPFRALKLWTVIRGVGLEGFRDMLRRHMTLAKYLAAELEKCGLFTIVREVLFGLVCFRLKPPRPDSDNAVLLKKLNTSFGYHLVHTINPKGEHVLRLSLAHPKLTHDHMDELVRSLVTAANEIPQAAAK